MKVKNLVLFLGILFLNSCYSGEVFEEGGESFYKLYGNGTIQEAVAMNIAADGSVFILGNQYVRNQDSSAVVVIKATKAGNQLWSERYYGRGKSVAKTLLPLSSGELLVLASDQEPGETAAMPVLYVVSEEGRLVSTIHLEAEDSAAESTESRVPEDLVSDGEGVVFILGNVRSAGGQTLRSFIQKVDIRTGEILDEREFRDSEMTEAKRILRGENRLFVVGNTSLGVGDAQGRNMFLSTFSDHLVEAGHVVFGGSRNDTFKKAILNSDNELVIVASEQENNTATVEGVMYFINPYTRAVSNISDLDFGSGEDPQAIEEDVNGDLFIAVKTEARRGKSNIMLGKTNHAGVPLWSSQKHIGGSGDDRTAQVAISEGYVYLLSTLDMRNENTLISLTKIRF